MPASPRDDNRSVAIGAKSDISNAFVPLECNPVTKALKVETQTIDVEIGAVEIKNSTDDIRATVGANGLHVDVQASALPTGAATSAKQLADDHNVTVSNMIPAVETGLATSALQLVDGHAVTIDNISTNEVFIRGSQSAGSAVDGEVVTVQGIAGATAIAVTESSPLTGFATSAGQLADGHNVTIDNIISNEVYVRGSGTAGTADAAVLTIQGIASMTALSVTESTPLTGFATSAGQLADGHNVTIDNIITNEVFVRGGGTAGSPQAGEVLAVQGISSGTAMAVTETTPISGFATSAKQQPPVTTITEYNITLTNADTQYSQALPENTRELRFRCRTLFDVRYSFTTGKVATPTAPYLVLPAGSDYISDNNNLTSTTLYLASAEAGVIVELEVYV